MAQFNLLTEPLIRMDAAGGRARASLPEALAALMRDDVRAFPALRPHQRHAWHAFLAQLGAMALRNSGGDEPPRDADGWAALIRGLTPDWPGDEPWHMVADDIALPAFMQPPASSGDRAKDYKGAVSTPDELDMLVTSKNHDLKSSVIADAGADDWLFALIALQTMEGYPGAGNYGISRMNGGLGNRPAFSAAPLGGTGAHVRRDIAALLAGLDAGSLDDYPMREDGVGLLWAKAWDGAKGEALRPNDLHPFYIEICRRIRLTAGAGGGISALRANSKGARVDAKALNGRTGDPWTPFNAKDSKSLTLAQGGFTYKRVVEYMTPGDWRQPLLLMPTPDEERGGGEMRLVARAMVRGQGKTEGYYERVIPLKERTFRAFGRGAGADMETLGQIARQRIEQVGAAQRILSHAIQVYAARGDSGNVSPEHRRLAAPYLNRLDSIVDARFFDDLQAEFGAGDEDARRRIRKEWLLNGAGKDGVIDHARRVLGDAEDELPCPAIHRYRARVNAEGLFDGRMRGGNGFAWVYADESKKEDE